MQVACKTTVPNEGWKDHSSREGARRDLLLVAILVALLGLIARSSSGRAVRAGAVAVGGALDLLAALEQKLTQDAEGFGGSVCARDPNMSVT